MISPGFSPGSHCLSRENGLIYGHVEEQSSTDHELKTMSDRSTYQTSHAGDKERHRLGHPGGSKSHSVSNSSEETVDWIPAHLRDSVQMTKDRRSSDEAAHGASHLMNLRDSVSIAHGSETSRLLMSARHTAAETESLSYGTLEHMQVQHEKIDTARASVAKMENLSSSVREYLRSIESWSQRRVLLLRVLMILLFIINVALLTRLILNDGNLLR